MPATRGRRAYKKFYTQAQIVKKIKSEKQEKYNWKSASVTCATFFKNLIKRKFSNIFRWVYCFENQCRRYGGSGGRGMPLTYACSHCFGQL